jgi:hypothetical protein
MYKPKELYPLTQIPEQEYLNDIICGTRLMKKPYVIMVAGSRYPDNEKDRFSLGLINREAVPFIRVEGEVIIIDTDKVYIRERAIMKFADEAEGNMTITFPEKPRWCDAYIADMPKLMERFGKLKMTELEKILGETINNANKRKGKVPDKNQ